MSEARDVGERWFETVTRGDPAAIEALLAPSCDFAAPGAALSNASEAARYVAAFADAFPDAAFTIGRWIEAGATAVAEGRYVGTHTGDLATPRGAIPPTRRSVEVPFAAILEAAGGVLSMHRAYWDNVSFFGQLGLMPGPGAR